MSSGEHSNIGVVFFAVGFSLMMALDWTWRWDKELMMKPSQKGGSQMKPD